MSKLNKSYWRCCCWLNGSIKDLERYSLYSRGFIKLVPSSTFTLHCWVSLSWWWWVLCTLSEWPLSSSIGMEVSATLEYWPVSSCTRALKFEALVFTFTGLEIYVTLISFLSLLLLALLFFMVQLANNVTCWHNTTQTGNKIEAKGGVVFMCL